MNGLSVAKQDAIAMVPSWQYLAHIKTLLEARDPVMNCTPAVKVLFPSPTIRLAKDPTVYRLVILKGTFS